jgi:hypothetical protein
MTARYKRVSKTDPGGEEEEKKSRGAIVEKISAKIQALAWILGSVVIVVVTDLPSVIHSDKINRSADRSVILRCLLSSLLSLCSLRLFSTYSVRYAFTWLSLRIHLAFSTRSRGFCYIAFKWRSPRIRLVFAMHSLGVRDAFT